MLAFVSIHMVCEYTDKIWVETSSNVYYVIPPKNKNKITVETFIVIPIIFSVCTCIDE